MYFSGTLNHLSFCSVADGNEKVVPLALDVVVPTGVDGGPENITPFKKQDVFHHFLKIDQDTFKEKSEIYKEIQEHEQRIQMLREKLSALEKEAIEKKSILIEKYQIANKQTLS